MENNRFYLLVGLLGVLFVGMTCILGLPARMRGSLKYIPSVAAGMAVLVFLSKTLFFSEGFESLGYVILTLISAIVFVVSIVTALVIEFVKRRKKSESRTGGT